MMKLILLGFTIGPMLLATTAKAQFSDTVHHYIGIMSTATLNNTNASSSYVSNQSLKIGVKKEDLVLNGAASWVYGRQEATLTNNDFTSSLDLDLHRTIPHFYYWGLANYLSSYSLKVNEQYQTGLGIAYNFIDSKTLQVNVSDGLLYEKSDIIMPDTVRDIYRTYRNSLRVMIRWEMTGMISFSTTAFFQNSLSSGNDYIVKTNAALDIKLRKWLHLTSAFNYNMFSRTKQENTLFTYGLSIDRFF